MKVYTIDEINRFGINYHRLRNSFTLRILNRVFVRSADFPKRFQEQAIAAYTKMGQNQVNGFLVETTPFLLTLWTEKTEQNPTNLPKTTQEEQDKMDNSVSHTRHYRGVPYQSSSHPQMLTDLDLEKLAVENPELRGYIQKKLNFPDHAFKTYRGIPY